MTTSDPQHTPKKIEDILQVHGPAGVPGFAGFRNRLASEGRLPDVNAGKPEPKEPKRPKHGSPSQPNVLWLMADQLRADTFGYMNHPMVQTPNLDRLAARGTVFSRSYCTMGVCVPSRASFFTGRYLYGHGAINNHYPMRSVEEVPDFISLFKEAGYRCANIGKHHCGRPANQVWEFLDNHPDAFGTTAPTDVAFDPAVMPEAVYLGGKPTRNPNDILHGIYPGSVQSSKSYQLANRAIKFLYWNDDPRPWMLRVSIDDPHPPVTPPEPYASMYDPDAIPKDLIEGQQSSLAGKPKTVQDWAKGRYFQDISERDHRLHIARYFGLITHLDAQLGRILDYLEEIGEAENTLILFNSDHGHMLGEHSLTHKGPGFYEGTAAIPTLLSWPGHIPEGKKVDALVEGVDLAPTLLDVAGIENTRNIAFDGHSWRPLLDGSKDKIRDYAFCQFEDYVFGVIGPRWKLTRYDSDPGQGELYDLENDPLEKMNLYNLPDFKAIQGELEAALANWRAHHAQAKNHPNAAAFNR